MGFVAFDDHDDDYDYDEKIEWEANKSFDQEDVTIAYEEASCL